jgi:nucleotide-binding universal stress UspA family protein
VHCLPFAPPPVVSSEIPLLSAGEEGRLAAERRLRAAVGPRADVKVLWSEPVGGILNLARAQGVGLTVIWTHGRSRLHALFHGNCCDRVVRLAPSPVLVVPVGATSSAAP